ncbi:putative short-chain dehydrogenase reductase sdr protein [Mycena sanguinolenta]|uniref:Putative short-chain dehydrogenase reductase sdr protein n=1 Tax=Mycena sanguinolenta TaxID=230812 RepID=A0A8H7D1H9_9AGAR|nr:putative short-chain dehydrogenase reductase sdr protein [Mycena sanguinolenta]
MPRFFITGSSDGLGLLTAQRLLSRGHSVVLHARSSARADETRAKCPKAEVILIGDLTSLEETKALAAEANRFGPYDAVLHNAGVYLGMERVPGKSGLPSLFAVNTLAPYILTCLIDKPKRLLFVSSGMHRSGRVNVDGDEEKLLRSDYSDSKLHDVMLAKVFARRWKDVASFSADPGWVPTKMGGRSAPENIDDGVNTFVMAALGEGDATSANTGAYFKKSRVHDSSSLAKDEALQERLVKELERISGVKIPE